MHKSYIVMILIFLLFQVGAYVFFHEKDKQIFDHLQNGEDSGSLYKENEAYIYQSLLQNSTEHIPLSKRPATSTSLSIFEKELSIWAENQTIPTAIIDDVENLFQRVKEGSVQGYVAVENAIIYLDIEDDIRIHIAYETQAKKIVSFEYNRKENIPMMNLQDTVVKYQAYLQLTGDIRVSDDGVLRIGDLVLHVHIKDTLLQMRVQPIST